MIKVLHVDDDRLTFEITRISLTRIDPDLDISWSASATAALERLGAEPFDCVISDYQMPGMDGLELLRRIRRNHPDTTFIFLTSQSDERKAIEALRTGSDDYFSKEMHIAHFQRLANSIRRHVEANGERALRRQENRVLVQSTAIIRGLSDSASFGFCVSGSGGKIEFCNRRFGNIVGFTPERLPEGIDALYDFLRERTLEPDLLPADFAGGHGSIELPLRDGTVIDLSLQRLDTESATEGYLCICHDRTELFHARQENDGMARFLDENHMGVIQLAADGTILHASRAAQPLLRLWKAAPGGTIPLRLRKTALHSRRDRRPVDCVDSFGRQNYLLRFHPFRTGDRLVLFSLNISGESHLEEKLEELRALWSSTLQMLNDGEGLIAEEG